MQAKAKDNDLSKNNNKSLQGSIEDEDDKNSVTLRELGEEDI